MRTYILLTLISVCQIVKAQVTINGQILDKQSMKPIPYANIGITKSNIGTGAFENSKLNS